MSSCIAHICVTSPRNEWASVFSNLQLNQMICCIVHNCATYPRNGWASAFSNVQLEWMICCIVHTCVSSLQNGWACDHSDFQLGQMFSCIGHIWKGSLHCCGSSHGSQGFCCPSLETSRQNLPSKRNQPWAKGGKHILRIQNQYLNTLLCPLSLFTV